MFIAFILENKLILSKSETILHFAPEEYLIKYLRKGNFSNYIKTNLESGKYEGAVKISINEINFKDSSIDIIICLHMLEHIENDIQSLSELFRVIKKGGKLILSVPIYGEKTFEIQDLSNEERSLQYGIDQHMRLNGLDLKNKLTKVGFDVDIIAANDLKGNYFDLSQDTPHFNSDKYLFCCGKN